jgi:alpha-glucuronidase
MQRVMMTSREACVDYMMPLGLHHIFKFDHHYGPEPDGFKAEYPIEWCPVYYHKADTLGIGFDRSSTGSNAVAQYRHPYDSIYNDLRTCPEEYLLWFHHVGWNYRLKSGQTLWQGLVAHYYRGVETVESYVQTWQLMRPYVDAQRWQEVDNRLHIQLDNAREWRDTCLKYFQTFSHQPIIKK